MQITLTGVVAIQLQAFRNALTNELGATPTWNMVIKKLLDAWKGNKELIVKVKSKESKIDGMHDKTEKYLEMALTRPSAPIMPMMQQTNMPPQLPPPPPNLSLPPKAPPLKMLDVTVSEDLKDDFMAELQSVVGIGRKPSEILIATNAEHGDEEQETMEEYQKRKDDRKSNPKKFKQTDD